MLKKFRIRVNGKEYLVEMEDLNPEIQFTAAPQAVAQQLPLQTQTEVAAPAPEVARPQVEKGEGVEITAPMPGNILEIKVSTGTTVTENQPLLVLEAMKMENVIVAPKAGQVTSILVQKGDVVDVGNVLVTIN